MLVNVVVAVLLEKIIDDDEVKNMSEKLADAQREIEELRLIAHAALAADDDAFSSDAGGRNGHGGGQAGTEMQPVNEAPARRAKRLSEAYLSRRLSEIQASSDDLGAGE